MSIIKSKKLKNFDVDAENKTVSISYEIILTDDIEGELARKKYRRAFVPGQVEEIKAWAEVGNQNPYIVFLNSIWTPAVISAYQASLEE